MDHYEENASPPDFVLVCENEECGAREPAPADLTLGDCIECASCGEIMHVEFE